MHFGSVSGSGRVVCGGSGSGGSGCGRLAVAAAVVAVVVVSLGMTLCLQIVRFSCLLKRHNGRTDLQMDL